MARKADLGYIIIDEQIKKSRLAQTSEDGKEAEGEKKVTAKGCKITRSDSSMRYDAGKQKYLRY